MSEIDDALVALKAIVATVDPNPSPALAELWVYPTDWPIRINTLPVAIVYRATNRRRQMGSKSIGLARHQWIAGVDLLLAHGPLSTDDLIVDASLLFSPWLRALDTVLCNNLSLSGTAVIIGDGQPNGTLFEYIDTHLQWFKQVYWGIRIEIPVMQVWPRDVGG